MMTRLLPFPRFGIKAIAFGVVAVGVMAVAEGGGRSVSGLAELLSATAWQGAYRQDLALDSSPEAAELHLATFGWSGKAMVETAICPPGEAARPGPLGYATGRTDQPL